MYACESIVQTIDNSDVFRRYFEHAQSQARLCLDARVKNLRASKVRFASHSKPLSRLVLFIEPIITVALRILEERGRGDERAQRAVAFLNTVDSEKFLQLALMADAGVEAEHLLRIHDGGADTAEMIRQAADFHRRITFMFLDGGVWKIPGFGDFALRQLRHQVVWTVAGNTRTSALQQFMLFNIIRIIGLCVTL